MKEFGKGRPTHNNVEGDLCTSCIYRLFITVKWTNQILGQGWGNFLTGEPPSVLNLEKRGVGVGGWCECSGDPNHR